MMDLAERLASHVTVTDGGWESPCWLSDYKTNNSGYCQAKFDGKHHLVHRLAYEIHVGPIPAGLDIDHLCRNKTCCNPEHLEAVTRAENTRRGKLSALRASSLYCAHGHFLGGPGGYSDPSGKRRCRECARRFDRAYAARRRGERVS